MTIDLVQLSKTMAYALRHNPSSFGLHLDEEGWVTIEDLLTALRQKRREWQQLRAEDFVAVINSSDKKRYEISGDKIRAYYGHSFEQRVQYQKVIPPALLFHGTTPRAAQLIRQEGLKPMGRQYVHLAEDAETARVVALRRTKKPVILKIAALQAYEQGVLFYSGNDKVWLAEPISPAFIDL